MQQSEDNNLFFVCDIIMFVNFMLTVIYANIWRYVHSVLQKMNTLHVNDHKKEKNN